LLLGAAWVIAMQAGGDGQLPLWFLSDSLGRAVGNTYFGPPPNYLEANQDALGVGAIVLMLMAAILFREDHRVRIAGLVAVGAALYVSKFPGLYQVGRTLLPLAAPTRAAVLLPLCAGMLVTVVLTRWDEQPPSWRQGALRSALRMVLPALVIVFVAATRFGNQPALQFRPLADGIGLCCVLGVVVLAGVQRSLPHGVVPWLLAVLTVLAVGYPGWRFHPTVPQQQIYPRTPAIDALLAAHAEHPGSRVFAADLGYLPPNSPQVFGLSQSLGYDAFDPFEYTFLLQNLTVPPALHRKEWHNGSFGLGTAGWRLLGSRWVVGREREVPPEFRVIHRSAGAQILEDLGAYPRAFLVGDAYLIHDDPHRMTRQNGREAVAVDRVELATLSEPRLSSASTVVVAHDAPDRIELALQCDGNGYLVLLDEWFPGWQATLDGVAVPIEQAFFCFRAVAVGAGEHRVVFSYRPRSVSWGDRVTWLSLLLLPLLVALTTWLTRRAERVLARET
jgi:hypothetical protein